MFLYAIHKKNRNSTVQFEAEALLLIVGIAETFALSILTAIKLMSRIYESTTKEQ